MEKSILSIIPFLERLWHLGTFYSNVKNHRYIGTCRQRLLYNNFLLRKAIIKTIKLSTVLWFLFPESIYWHTHSAQNLIPGKVQEGKKIKAEFTTNWRSCRNHLTCVYLMTVHGKLLNIPLQQDPSFATQLSYSVDTLSREWVCFFSPQPGRIKDPAPGTAASFPGT